VKEIRSSSYNEYVECMIWNMFLLYIVSLTTYSFFHSFLNSLHYSKRYAQEQDNHWGMPPEMSKGQVPYNHSKRPDTREARDNLQARVFLHSFVNRQAQQNIGPKIRYLLRAENEIYISTKFHINFCQIYENIKIVQYKFDNFLRMQNTNKNRIRPAVLN
jgi:hypothetical protein